MSSVKTCHTKTGKPVRLWQGDCMDLMEDKPENHWDLAIVDPQYAWNSGNAFPSVVGNHGSLAYNDKRPDPEYFSMLMRTTKNQIIWGGNYFLSDLHDTKCMITWYKQQPVETYADSEIAWTSFTDRHCAVFDYRYFGFVNVESDKCHPNQKPVHLYRWILQNYAEEGDVILDTHGGSFSLAIACYIEDFELDIIELDEDYYSDAVKRFESHISQQTMF